MPPNSHVPGRGRAQPLRLEDVLRRLPESELESLIGRLRVRIDEAKRIDVPSQVARALLALPELRDPGVLAAPTRELLYRIVESGGVLTVPRVPSAVEPLVARGLVFVRAAAQLGGVDLLLPVAYLLQLRTWEGEDPRGLRPLLVQTNPDVAASIATHYLGRPATPPVVLSLEAAWDTLTDPEQLRASIDALAPLERKLLASIEEVGGEVDTEELLDLEREPMRLRGATGATPSRRGVGFALERRGFLIPVHPNRHVIPTEVALVVGERRRAEREAQRREILTFVLGEDHAPRRARFAEDPVPLVLAMAIAVRDPSVEVRPGVGTPRSLVTKLAARFGKPPENVAVLVSLSRAVGLWEASVMSTAAPPGSFRVHDLGRVLFEAWRRGGAWDEARPDGEVLRIAADARESSPIGVIREIVLEALAELGDGNWAPWEAVAAYVRADPRAPGVGRLIERWSQRVGIEAPTPAEVARRIALESLHVLGVVDLGDPDSEEDDVGTTLRITPRGRSFLEGSSPRSEPEPSRFVDNELLRVGGQSRIGTIVALAPFVEVGSVAGSLDISLTAQAVSLALSAGYDTEVMRGRLEAVAALPDPIARLLVQASAVLGRAEFVATEGFLWVEDPEVREMLRTRRQTSELFVDPSPPAGLLIAPGVDMERLTRRCRGLGVEVIVDGEVYRTRTVAPTSRGSGARRLSSELTKSVTPSSRRSTGTMKSVQAQGPRASTIPPSRSTSTTQPPASSSRPPPCDEAPATRVSIRDSYAPPSKRGR
ncbi:MAG: hypothetical protein JW751_08535 [Polyangiaceae bacterium]|nr:hypothetical protein [Polyangiaceae bacterium]